jgi:hypothetical protein
MEVEHMATQRPTDEPTDEQREWPIPLGSLGAVEYRVEFDDETYQRVRDAYERAVAGGYTDNFETFALNHCPGEWTVTVDGEQVDHAGGE